MRTEIIDEAIEKYVAERMSRGKRAAAQRLVSFAYLRFEGEELEEFRDRICGFSRYYADFLRVMVNPFKGPELAWFASIITVAIYGAYLMDSGQQFNLGAMLVSGALVNGWSLVRNVLEKWCDFGVKIAIYDELVSVAKAEIG